jgi:hypothetical protein
MIGYDKYTYVNFHNIGSSFKLLSGMAYAGVTAIFLSMNQYNMISIHQYIKMGEGSDHFFVTI